HDASTVLPNRGRLCTVSDLTSRFSKSSFSTEDKRARRARPSTKIPAEAGLGGHEGTHGEQLFPRLTGEVRSGSVSCSGPNVVPGRRSLRRRGAIGWRVEAHCAPVPPGYLRRGKYSYGYAKRGDARFTRGTNWPLRGLCMNEAGGSMPRYFFHLAFGGRLVPDEEGVELPDRSAARDEALAVIRDLSDRRTGGNPRRWAGWFLQVADEQGHFSRTPVAHPALEIVGLPAEEHSLESTVPVTKRVRRAARAELARELAVRREHTAQLLEHSYRLQRELSSLCAANQSILARARELVAYARVATAGRYETELFRAANALARPSAAPPA